MKTLQKSSLALQNRLTQQNIECNSSHVLEVGSILFTDKYKITLFQIKLKSDSNFREKYKTIACSLWLGIIAFCSVSVGILQYLYG